MNCKWPDSGRMSASWLPLAGLLYFASMKMLLITLLVLSLALLSGCIMPNPEEQIAVNEVKLAQEGYVLPEVGSKAPAISTQDSAGNSFVLSEALENGPVVLFFYPANDTPNSTNQLHILDRLQKELVEKGSNIQLYAINPANPAETAKFLSREEISLPVLHDPGLEISEQYGCASTENTTQMQERSVVGIAQDGTLAFFQRRFFQQAATQKLLEGPDFFNIATE